MAKKIIKAQMKQRRDTLENWAAANPVLLDGELGFIEGVTDRFKIGDGKTAWNDLPFFSGSFDPSGKYPDLIAGDLAGRGESVPAEFGFRASGGKSIKDGRAYIKRIKGNSVVWNQLWDASKASVQDGTMSEENGIVSILPTGTFSGLKQGLPYDLATKKVLVIVQSSANNLSANVAQQDSPLTKIGTIFYAIITAKLGSVVTIYSLNATESFTISSIRICDLTKAFPNDWQNINTIEDFNARVATLGVDLNAYKEGEVIHCNTESIKSVGDNAWDEEWIAGRLNTDTGQLNLGNNGITSKNYIRVLPNETYYCGYNAAPIFAMFFDAEYALITGVNGSNNFVSIRNTQFTTPANAAYMKFYVADNNLATYNNDIMITLLHSGWKQDTDAGYQPYWQDTLPLPIIRKYFPDGMKLAGTAHDEIRFNKASGKWEAVQRIGSVDMGSMAWSYDSANQVFTSYTIMDLMTHPAEVSERAMGLLCSKYSPSSTYIASTMDDKSWLRIPKSVTIKDTSYTDAATFKADMAGVILYYELAEPIVTELDAEDQNFRDYYNVADFGTEQSQSSVPSAAFSADIIYQFNAVDMIREHEIEINELQSIIATMQAQLTSLINGGQ